MTEYQAKKMAKIAVQNWKNRLIQEKITFTRNNRELLLRTVSICRIMLFREKWGFEQVWKSSGA